MQVIEKVKVVPEGYNGAGMNYDGCNRRDVNGKANAGLTLGIIGTALGAWALFGNRRSSVLGGAGGGMLGDGSTNINVLGATAGSGSGAPTAFQAWEKSCEDTLALQGGLYQWALTHRINALKIENVLIVNCLVFILTGVIVLMLLLRKITLTILIFTNILVMLMMISVKSYLI